MRQPERERPSGLKTQTRSSIDQVFAERPACRRLFNLVADFIGSLGPAQVIPRKTQVAFARARRFAWLWLPQLWITKQPPDSITVTFGLDHRVRDTRIKQSVEPYPGRFTHHIVITKASDFDARVKGWIREAYDRAREAKRSRAPTHTFSKGKQAGA